MDDPGWKRMNRFVNSLGLSWRSSSKCTKMLVYGSLGVVVLFVIGALILSDEKKHLLNSKVSTSLSTLRFLARTTPGRPSAVQPPPLVKQALPDYNIPMSALRVDDIHVCVAMSTLLDTGGTEQWLWGVVDSVYHKPPFVLHAMQVNDYWSHAAVKDIHSRRIKFNPSSRTMVQECDVIIQTGTQPIPTYNFLRPVPRVLVIHGSKGCQWTEAYAAKASSYSEIVAVSRDATFTVPEEQRARVKVIPSIVHRSRFQVQRSKSELLELWNLPQDKKILMYVGRISREKNPQYFVDVVAQLGPEWIGVLVGPLYFQEWMPVIKDPNRVFFVGPYQNVADAINLCDVMLMASPNEGGPIILIEAWGQRKPFFMRRTGLAAEHPHSVFMIDEKETADVTAAAVNSVATKVLAGDESVMRVLKNGYESYEKYHSEETIVPKWQAVINSAYLGLLQNDEAGLYYPKLNIRAVHDFHGNPSHIRVTSIGRTRLLQNLNTDYNSLSLAEMDITYILKQMYNAKRAHISGTVASQPQGPGAVAAAAAAKAVAAAAPHNTPQSADRMGDPSQVLQMQPVRAVLQVEYETVSDGLPIQRDGSTGSHKVSAGFLDVRVRRKTSGLGTSEATVGPGGQNPTDDLQLSIRLEAEALNRVKTLLMPPVGFEYLSILFRIRGGMTINVLGVSIKSSSDF